MYYIRTWYKDSNGKVFHEDKEYPEMYEIFKCIPYRAEIIDSTQIIYSDTEKLCRKYDSSLDKEEQNNQKF
jgi:hypothetical protein